MATRERAAETVRSRRGAAAAELHSPKPHASARVRRARRNLSEHECRSEHTWRECGTRGVSSLPLLSPSTYLPRSSSSHQPPTDPPQPATPLHPPCLLRATSNCPRPEPPPAFLAATGEQGRHTPLELTPAGKLRTLSWLLASHTPALYSSGRLLACERSLDSSSLLHRQ